MRSHPTSSQTPYRERFREYLALHRYRKTPERFALLDKAMTLSGHFGVDELYASMEKDGYHVSRATVYNTLELLCDCGLLNRHIFGARKSRYEVALGSHVHLICQRCGAIREVEQPDFNALLSRAGFGGFRPAYFSTMVYGLCEECGRRGESAEADDGRLMTD